MIRQSEMFDLQQDTTLIYTEQTDWQTDMLNTISLQFSGHNYLIGAVERSDTDRSAWRLPQRCTRFVPRIKNETKLLLDLRVQLHLAIFLAECFKIYIYIDKFHIKFEYCFSSHFNKFTFNIIPGMEINGSPVARGHRIFRRTTRFWKVVVWQATRFLRHF